MSERFQYIGLDFEDKGIMEGQYLRKGALTLLVIRNKNEVKFSFVFCNPKDKYYKRIGKQLVVENMMNDNYFILRIHKKDGFRQIMYRIIAMLVAFDEVPSYGKNSMYYLLGDYAL